MENKENKPQLNPKILGEVEFEKIDLKQFEGVKSQIKTYTFEEHHEFGLYVKVVSQFLDTEEKVYASVVLGLTEQKDDNGKHVGYVWGSESKTALFLKRFNAKSFDDLLGKEITIRYELKKNGKQILTF